MHASLQYEREKPPRPGGDRSQHQSSDRSAERSSDRRRRDGVGGRARLETPDERRSAPRAPARSAAVIFDQLQNSKPTVPLQVWLLAGASCFAVCAALVLATVAITRWGSDGELYPPPPPPHHRAADDLGTYRATNEPRSKHLKASESEQDNDISSAILEKLSMFKNFMNRDSRKENQKETLVHKPQYHPEFDPSMTHSERRIKKKDQANSTKHNETQASLHVNLNGKDIPEFRPTLPDIFVKQSDIKLPDGYVEGLRKYDIDYYNSDILDQEDPLYDDYAQSNSMTNYLIEKIQDLYQWVSTDPELEGVKNSTDRLFKKKGENSSSNELGELLQALNESIVEGNVSIVMLKLKDLYFGGENFTNVKAVHRTILKNTTDLLSFGMLTLDVMLLHNIQIMAWDSQEASGLKMLQDPEVFAFNALFMEATKVEAKRQEVLGYKEGSLTHLRRREPSQDGDDASLGRGLLEAVLELGLSAARAAVHLGRAYKNAKSTLKQITNREASLQSHLARNSDSNAHALSHLRSSYDREEAQDGGRNMTDARNGRYTELDCVWYLYCRNLVATARLAAPYGTMARINGLALRMITGELPPEKALDTLIVEATDGWSELHCARMLPRCSHADAASVVLESVLQPHRKGHSAEHHKRP